MGGCVVSVMDRLNAARTIPDPRHDAFERRRAACVDGCFVQRLPETETPHSSAVYRLGDMSDAQHAAFLEGAATRPTLYAALMQSCAARKANFAVGYRQVKAVEKVEAAETESGTAPRAQAITHFDETVKLTYGELQARIFAFGAGLAALGVTASGNVSIYLDTCLQWLMGAYGIWSCGAVVCTVYANLGEVALAHALHETESQAILCGAGNASNVLKLMLNGVLPQAPIIYVGTLPASLDAHGLAMLSFAEVEAKGVAALAEGAKPGSGPVDDDALALIMYTSGTTAEPKGVMHTHRSLAGGMHVLMPTVEHLLGSPQPDEAYLSYLPMAHIMEFTLTSLFMARGAFIGFGTPRTLTDATARPLGDIRTFNPTLFVGVPRIFDALRKAVEAKLPPAGTLKRRILDRAFESRLAAIRDGKDTPFWNEKVFAASQSLMGSRLRTMLSGGGPTSESTHNFVNVMFGRLTIGYGLTETICVGGMQMPGDTQTGTTGLMEPGQELRLADTEEYKHTDQPEPRGELCVRGPFLFKGYYKQPELTKQALDEDGWFHTGDVVSITPEGRLRIVGRVKALAKNCLGEYIAMEALEAVYSSNELLQPNGVCVLVHPNRRYITALALTDASRATAFAAKHGITGEYPALLKDPRFQEAAARSMAQTARNGNRAPFECVKRVRVLDDEWTPENDVLTAASKLKRRTIDRQYAATIQELFAEDD